MFIETGLESSLQEIDSNRAPQSGELSKSEPFSYRFLSDIAFQSALLTKGLFLFLSSARTRITAALANCVEKQSARKRDP